MPTAFDRAAYHAAEQLRRSWYLGQKWLSARMAQPVDLPEELKARMPSLAELRLALDALVAADWDNIAAGRYLPPERLDVLPIRALRKAGQYFADLPKVEARRRAGTNDAVPPGDGEVDYPRYYLQNFHYQTDGYLSRRSAELYDHQVEVLFGGAAAMMRRQALVPLAAVLGECGVRGARLVDLACGTGAFLREIKTNYPRLAVTGIDLSAFYLQTARERLAPWRDVTVIEASAEAVPLAAAETDVVTCSYLFHELPDRARQAVASEIARLLRPGGAAILVDSLQYGDAPALDALLEYFPRAFHEPYYASYARLDLAALFAEAGLVRTESRVAYLSKVVTFRKPG